MMILNSGDVIETEDCALELGRTFHDEGLDQVADVPSVANVVISQAEYDAYRECANLLRFLDDPKAMPRLKLHIGPEGEEYHACTYRDPCTGRVGVEYGDTPTEAMSAALRTIKHYRAQASAKAAA